MLVVAQIAEEGRGDYARDVEKGEQKGRRGLRQQGHFVGVCVEVGLRDAVSRALKDDGDAVDVESLVLQEIPRDLPRPIRARG